MYVYTRVYIAANIPQNKTICLRRARLFYDDVIGSR